tara:strand:+ start:2035 stop:3342 length:1308 start_codon:yes stop_codon:yes gene_type:complete
MTDCNTSSSNISGTPIAGEITQVGSKLSIDVVQAAHGFTAGNVIRFDVASNGYTLAQANSPQNAEVCGVVSDGTISTSIFNYVMAGDIVMNTFDTNNTISGSTGAEVFFLSSVTAGIMDSTPPNDAGSVLKTVIVRLPSTSSNGVTQDKGIVKNYVGNYLGGDTAVYMSGVNPVGSIHAFVGQSSTVPSGWAMCDGSPINVTTYPDFSTAINKRYGFRERLTFVGTEAPECQRVEDTAGRVANVIEKTSGSLLVEHVIIRSGNLINNVRGENGQASYTDTNLTISGFPPSTRLQFIDGTNSTGLTPTTITLESVLTPDFRNKFIMGATGDSTTKSGLNVQGGSEKIDMNLTANQSGSVNYGVSEPSSTGLTSIENIPPYVSVNWIVRVGDSSYTSFLNQLSLKTLSLTNLPTTDPNVAGSIYSEGGTLKVSNGTT